MSPRHRKRSQRTSSREKESKKKRGFSFKDRSGKAHGNAPHGKPIVHRTAPLKATVDKNHKGFGFLIFETKGHKDVFIPPRQAESLFHGDRVEVTLGHGGEVQSLRVIEHRFRELVGKFTPHPSHSARTSANPGGWVIYERKRAREEVYVPSVKADLHPPVRPNDWVRAKLHFHEKGPFPVTAEILEVYGQELPASADIGMIAAEYNLIEEHSEAAENEARRFPLESSESDWGKREDLRDVPFITIDGETARDFDDAIYVERNKSGYILWVGIADVSHYVTPASAIDKDAHSRGTSVYFAERAFHMLPRALSENLCSLKPNVPRLAMVAKMEFDRNGKKIRTELMEAVIQSKRRATYNEIEAEWAANKSNASWEFTPHFGLYQALRKMRTDRGSIDFDLPEAELLVEPTGEVISIKMRARFDSHRLIEEFMIAANEAVTEWIMERRWPFVFRIHDEPEAEALDKFQALAKSVGINFSLEKVNSPRLLAEIVRRFESHPAQSLLNMAFLRSMKQAIYSATHGIHFGLASQAYTHFTSPIRRYPDLVVHRLLRHALRQDKLDRTKLERELESICEHCSYRERLASDAERESIKLKQTRAMLAHLGDEFNGRIVGMIDTGLFVRIDDPFVEGMISRESMMDDFYQFNEERMIFYGRRKKRTFKIGDQVNVRVLRADIDRRQIDFGLV